MIQNKIRLKAKGFHKYSGKARGICEQIVDDCWNGIFFQTSTTNFPQFWTRDFGLCADSLLKLGHRDKVEKTILYALDTFSKYGKVTTTITPSGKPYNFPRFAVDSLPWLLRSIALLNKKSTTDQFRDFLEQQVNLFIEGVVTSGGLVKSNHFSSIKDFSIRRSSCYDNCMLAILSESLDKLKLTNPLRGYNYTKLIKGNFWNGKYFYDDLNKKDYVASDANLFPFYFRIINDKKMLRNAVEQIQVNGLDTPLPLKYTTKNAKVKFIWQEFFMKHYELNSIWTHIGPLYISLVKQVDKGAAVKYVSRYTKFIENYKNYPEVLTADGKPFIAQFYHSDEGMLWAANYLTL
jgi:hypothetical protein